MAFRFLVARPHQARTIAALAAAGSAWTTATDGCAWGGDDDGKTRSRCDAPPPAASNAKQSEQREESYHSLFPKRQLYRPKKEYPLWDANWDSRQPAALEDADAERRRQRMIRKTGVTRHVILIRHGQYDETHKEDEKRILTPLGREQADLTGRRIAEIIRGETMTADDDDDEETDDERNSDEKAGGATRSSSSSKKKQKKKRATPCRVKVIRVSDLARAKETAAIIAQHLPGSVERSDPDPLLNEGRPAHHIPGGRASAEAIEKTDEQGTRIEEAFQKYFYRSQPGGGDKGNSDGDDENETHLHEFEIIVGHANVIRYFLMRALQLPPEAWLRFCNLNCSLTYVTIRPTGTVSCRMFGDIGHLPYSKSTFSGHHGFNW